MTEQERRAMLENPDAYTAEQMADAWDMTAGQCREGGAEYEWAARIADKEARKFRALAQRIEVPW